MMVQVVVAVVVVVVVVAEAIWLLHFPWMVALVAVEEVAGEETQIVDYI